MHSTRPFLITSDFPAIQRQSLEILQINLGYICNQRCVHCHVNAGPNRTESMSLKTASVVLRFLAASEVTTLDITGGAPEMHGVFRHLVVEARRLGIKVIDRCNLTVLEEPGQETLTDFLAEHQVEVVASMPCYLEENVDQQRGKGVFDKSIAALQKLNAAGYGDPDSGLVLNLVYNPQGPVLPPPQVSLEADYKRELNERYDVRFNQLFTLANMPIQRFGSMLISKGEFEDYMALLRQASRPENVETVMCRTLVSVDWRGFLYDCDFNQMLSLPMGWKGKPRVHLSELMGQSLTGNDIVVGDHCYGCTAGQGSSCGGALSRMPSISIIIPTLNEAETLPALLRTVQPWRDEGCEIIVVDGGSTDDTPALAEPHVDVICTAARGRASQMNAGAARAGGETLWFLHADTLPPSNSIETIRHAVTRGRGGWGRFDVRLSGRRCMLRIIEKMMNWRSRFTGIATGDQAIFVRRDWFTHAGGFPEIPLMEDIAFSRRMKRRASPVCLREVVTTFSRRWEERGIFRTVFLMWRLRLAYFLGADPRRLARDYRHG